MPEGTKVSTSTSSTMVPAYRIILVDGPNWGQRDPHQQRREPRIKVFPHSSNWKSSPYSNK